MAILNTEAIILKGWKLRETSKILQLYTRDYGKVRVVAKGGRDPKSPFKGCLEPMTHLNIIYYDKRTRDLQLLSKVDLIDPHYHIIGDMPRTTLGLAVAELTDKAVAGEESFPEVFDLLSGTLSALDRMDDFLEAYIWYFQTHFIGLMGYKPIWDSCLHCGTSLGLEGGAFHPESGGLICRNCGGGGLWVSSDTLEILFFLQRCNQDEAGSLKPGKAQKFEIRKLFDLYFRAHIEHMKRIESLRLYYSLCDAE
ncbi:DNA repair protein RecO [bacterium]|nr:DNA repair protein RecO [bacterium]